MALNVGDTLPNVSLKSQTGEMVNVKDFVGKKCVVLYFYPKDDTPGCTKEYCSFRDNYAEFQEAGAEVIGISGDDMASHQAFAAKHQLPFTLLSDVGNVTRKAFGVLATMGILPGRVTYVIDRAGIVRHIFNSQFNVQGHIDESLTVVKGLV